MSEVVKGKVTVKVHGVLKQKQLSGNWAVLYDGKGKKDRPPCLELYDENDQSTPVHTIILEHLKFPDKSYRQQEAFLVLSIKKEKHQFQFEDMESKEEWVQSFCHVSQDLWKQWASGRESSEIESDSVTDMSDNLLYDSFSKAPEFKVSVNPTQLSEANNLKGHYMVSPTQASLRLIEIDSPACKHEWLYRQIRKYGSTRKIFKLEVGRGCTTGPGELEFFTLDGKRLSEMIAMYTRQTFNQDHKQMFNQEQKSPQAKAAPPTPENDNYVDSQTSMVQTTSDLNSQQALSAGNPPRASELKESTKGKESRNSQGGSTGSLDSKRDAPIPVPRSSVNKPRKETSSTNGVGETAHFSDDKKIYQTSSGLTAPLNSQLKHELNSKLQVQPDPAQGHSAAEIEDDPTSDSVENISSRGSSESIKDKRKSAKERKKLEKEQKATEAKRKKQQEKELKEREKELKEQREREAKEEKERQKKMKKESKVREKLKGKKSLDIPAPEPAQYPDGNIYDEPVELLQNHPPSHEPESGYCEAGDFIPALQQAPESAAGAQAATPDEYAIPHKPKDSWKTRARPESQQIHQENYAAIKQASQSHSRRSRPPAAPQPSLPVEDGDETYNRLGDFHPSAPASENIYGMASAKNTIQAESAAVVENEYEDANTVLTGFSSRQGVKEVTDDYQETIVPQAGTMDISVASDRDYADVSHT